ncbi:MAG: hypothetical protein H7834_16260 [Magnetococcus sp. YQC-9]
MSSCLLRFQKTETKQAKAARGAFFRKNREKMLLEKSALKVKVKILGEESPRPSLFFLPIKRNFQALKSNLELADFNLPGPDASTGIKQPDFTRYPE